jgi:hypothetical protein
MRGSISLLKNLGVNAKAKNGNECLERIIDISNPAFASISYKNGTRVLGKLYNILNDKHWFRGSGGNG